MAAVDDVPMLEKIRSKKWAKPAGNAMRFTGNLLDGCLRDVPGSGIISGALQLGASILAPEVTNEDLQVNQKKILKGLEGLRLDSEEERMILRNKEGEMANAVGDIRENQEEMRKDLGEIREEMKKEFKNISYEILNVEYKLEDMKETLNATFVMVTEERYRRGVEQIDGAFKTFIKGATTNLDSALNNLESYIFELETNCNANLTAERLGEYLRIIHTRRGHEDQSMKMFDYILAVRAKYLFMLTAFYINKGDLIRVTNEFEDFNRFYRSFDDLYQRIRRNLVYTPRIQERRLAAIENATNGGETRKFKGFVPTIRRERPAENVMERRSNNVRSIKFVANLNQIKN